MLFPEKRVECTSDLLLCSTPPVKKRTDKASRAEILCNQLPRTSFTGEPQLSCRFTLNTGKSIIIKPCA